MLGSIHHINGGTLKLKTSETIASRMRVIDTLAKGGESPLDSCSCTSLFCAAMGVDLIHFSDGTRRTISVSRLSLSPFLLSTVDWITLLTAFIIQGLTEHASINIFASLFSRHHPSTRDTSTQR